MIKLRIPAFITHVGISTAVLLMTVNCCWGMGDKGVATEVADLPEQFLGVIVQGLDFSPDSSRIAIESDHEKINIWEWNAKRIAQTLMKPYGFGVGGTVHPLLYSPDGQWLAICEGRSEDLVVIRVWNTKTWQIAKDITDSNPVPGQAIVFTTDSKWLLRGIDRSKSNADTLIVSETGTWQQVWSSRIPAFGTTTMAMSPNGDFVAIGGLLLVRPENVTDPVQYMKQSRFVPQVHILDLRQRQVIRVLQGDAMGVVAWSPDNARIAIAGRLYVEIFDAQTGERLVHEKVDNSSGDMDLRYTPDGRYFIESSHNEMGTGFGLKIWDNNRRVLLQQMTGDIGGIAVSKDGKYLAVGMAGRTTIWEFKAPKPSR